jgi:hypothetical protein
VTITRSTASDDHAVDVLHPSISLEKSTTGVDADEAPGPAIPVGAEVVWEFTVTNDGDVDLTAIEVTDPVLGEALFGDPTHVFCSVPVLAVGAAVSCTAAGTAALGPHVNTAHATTTYVDLNGFRSDVTDSDSSYYHGVANGWLSDSSLCDIGDEFRLVFAPDLQAGPNHYRLASSNPGQFYLNLFGTTGGTVTVDVPYPFVTQGASPVHAYGGLRVLEDGCVEPSGAAAAIVGAGWGLGDFTDTNGDGVVGPGDVYTTVLSGLPTGIAYVNLHIDYGLEKSDGWRRQGDDAVGDASINPGLDGHVLQDGSVFTFGSSLPGGHDAMAAANVWKRIRGIGGFVRDSAAEPIAGVELTLTAADGTFVDIAVTDVDGWYHFGDIDRRGKAVSYLVEVSDLTFEAVLSGQVKWVRVDVVLS